jgi:hypothetical protein
VLRTRNLYLAILASAIAGGYCSYTARPLQAADTQKPQKTVIPFDFTSVYDKGVQGASVGDMFWAKLNRQKGFVIPETMKDVRDLCEEKKFKAAADTPIDQMKRIVKEDFGGDVGIWGTIELAPGAIGEIYNLTIKCVDFSVDPPKVIYEKSATTNSAAEVPHLYVKEALDALYDRKPGQPDSAKDQFAEENWKNNPNLVKGGDFEHGRGYPDGWEPLNARPDYYRYVSWRAEAGNPSNKVLRMDIPKDIAESTGVLYYSQFFKIHEGATYRFQCRYRTNGPSPKVFIKCYDEMPSVYKVRASYAAAQTAPETGSANQPGGGTDKVFREVYRSQQNLKGPKGEAWNVQTEDFTPKHTKYSPKAARVDLYGYLSPGIIEWDDVVVKEVIPATTSAQVKEKRHSLETKVTIKEMEENVRRSDELKAQERREREEAKAAAHKDQP